MPTALLKPAKPRAQIVDDVSGLRVTIPARRNWFLVAFLPAWLVGWVVGEVAVLGKLVTDPPDAGEGLFLFVWLVFWSIAGVLFIFFWLWNLAGKEIVALDEEALTVRYALGPSGWTRRFDRREVRDLRVSPSGMTDFRSSFGWWLGGFGTIAFDYGALRADERPTAARAKALNGAADLALASGDLGIARLRAEEALALHRIFGNAWGIANSGWELGYIAVEEGDWRPAREFLEESLRVFSELDDEHATLGATRTLAFMYDQAGDLERARAMHEDNLHRARALGNKPMQANLLGSLAYIALDQGRVGDAVSMLNENSSLYRELGDHVGIAVNLCRFAKALARARKPQTAVRLISCYETLREEIGGSEAWVAKMNEETLAAIRTQLDEAALAEAWEQGRALTADEAVALALDALVNSSAA